MSAKPVMGDMFWAPYHQDCLVQRMSSPMDRLAEIFRTKPDRQLWTRLEAFQPVLDPEAVVVILKKHGFRHDMVAGNLTFYLQEVGQAGYRTANRAQRAALHKDLDKLRRREYPDAPKYNFVGGLILPNGLTCDQDEYLYPGG